MDGLSGEALGRATPFKGEGSYTPPGVDSCVWDITSIHTYGVRIVPSFNPHEGRQACDVGDSALSNND